MYNFLHNDKENDFDHISQLSKIKRLIKLILKKKKSCTGGAYHIMLKGVNICLYTHYDNDLMKKRYKANPSIEDDIELIQYRYHYQHGEYLNLDDPKTFNEKLNWLKLYNRTPLMTQCADKYTVREYVKEKIGEEYLIPLLGAWDRAEDIDFSTLPDQFVLKVNWVSGQSIIVTDKSQLDIKATITQLNRWMKDNANLYLAAREWCYKNITPKIIAEEYISAFNQKIPPDYKFYCFNGTLKMSTLVTGRDDDQLRRSFFSVPDWTLSSMRYDATTHYNDLFWYCLFS